MISTANVFELSNGLTVLSEQMDQCKGVALGLFLNSGYRSDPKGKEGLSHLLEHMVFKGSADCTADEINRGLGSIGASVNAFTAEELTVFYLVVPACVLEEALFYLWQLVQPVFPMPELISEKHVIIEELEEFDAAPDAKLIRTAMSALFDGNSMANTPMGSLASLEAITREDLVEFARGVLVPVNTTLVVAGGFDREQLKVSVSRTFGAWSGSPSRTVEPEPLEIVRKDKVFHDNDLNQVHILCISPSVAIKDERRYDWAAFAAALGDSYGSRLYWELVESGLAEYVVAENESFTDTGILSVYTVTSPANCQVVMEKLWSELCTATMFNEDEIARARSKLSSRAVLGGEGPLNRMILLGRDWRYHGRIYNLENLMYSLERVTISSLSSSIGQLSPRDWSSFVLLPKRGP